MNRFIVLLALLAGAHASAQHHGHSPYAGEEARDLKALSAQEQRAWLEGQGLGLAKAAELNGHPGPMHVLEHAQALALSAEQQARTQALMQRHKAQVRALGAEFVAAERRLDDLFRTRTATPADVDALTATIGSLQARIRASHLNTHLEQMRLLQPEQVTAYNRLRGYTR